MTINIQYRQTNTLDEASVLKIYPQAFADEDLVPLVQVLLEQGEGVISMGAFETTIDASKNNEALAHVIFTLFRTSDKQTVPNAALLGPLCVLPKYQKQSLGSGLVNEGAEQLIAQGIHHIFVLGDPAYYCRLGFQPENNFQPPYPMPEEWADAWQSLTLAGAEPLSKGRCILPDIWMDQALWLP